MDSMALQDAAVGAVGGFFVALLVLYRLVGPSDADYERVPVARLDEIEQIERRLEVHGFLPRNGQCRVEARMIAGSVRPENSYLQYR